MSNIAVLGAGTWGIALAVMLADNHQVTVWSALEQEIDDLTKNRRHPFLPDATIIPDEMVFEKDIKTALNEKDIVLFAVPSPFVRSTTRLAAPFITEKQILVDVAKGIEGDTLFTMTQVIADELGNDKVPLVALSGPTHAEEVALGLPTAIVAAGKDEIAVKEVCKTFTTDFMRVYPNKDILGVELCGAIKNVIALAAGISAGLGYGDNAKAALITRGAAEMARLGLAMGCQTQTFAGLAGVGDLIVTATSVHSRNNRCGTLIGQGVEVGAAVKQVGMVVEGINALSAVMKLAKRYEVEMPIVQAVNDVINEGLDPRTAVQNLMQRESKANEFDD